MTAERLFYIILPDIHSIGPLDAVQLAVDACDKA